MNELELFSAMKLMATVSKSVVPKEGVNLDAPRSRVFAMYIRTTRLFDAGRILIGGHLPEEALIVGRSLFEEALQLQELAADPENLIALVVSWVSNSLQEKEGLIHEAVSLKLENSPDDVLAKLSRERELIQAYARKHIVGKMKRFMKTRDAAFRFGRRDDYWTFALSHEMVHGSEMAHLFGGERSSPDSVSVFAKTTDPDLLFAAAGFIGASLVDACNAASSIFGWRVPPELQILVEGIRSRERKSAG